MAAKKKEKYRCEACGYETAKWLGQCPECHTWNKMKPVNEAEESVSAGLGRTTASSAGNAYTKGKAKISRLKQVRYDASERLCYWNRRIGPCSGRRDYTGFYDCSGRLSREPESPHSCCRRHKDWQSRDIMSCMLQEKRVRAS